nr:extended synaptotagmin-2-like [Chlorocebus sabaeus]
MTSPSREEAGVRRSRVPSEGRWRGAEPPGISASTQPSSAGRAARHGGAMSGARGEGPEAGAGGAGGRAAPENPGGVLSLELPGLLAQLARSFALLLPVYALGYLGLSFSWVLLALALLAWCRRSRGLKALRLCRALALLEDEERAVRLGVRACDLPAWGHFPLEEKRSLFPVRSKA